MTVVFVGFVGRRSSSSVVGRLQIVIMCIYMCKQYGTTTTPKILSGALRIVLGFDLFATHADADRTPDVGHERVLQKAG